MQNEWNNQRYYGNGKRGHNIPSIFCCEWFCVDNRVVFLAISYFLCVFVTFTRYCAAKSCFADEILGIWRGEAVFFVLFITLCNTVQCLKNTFILTKCEKKTTKYYLLLINNKVMIKSWLLKRFIILIYICTPFHNIWIRRRLVYDVYREVVIQNQMKEHRFDEVIEIIYKEERIDFGTII